MPRCTLWRAENNIQKLIPPTAVWDPETELRSSGLAASAYPLSRPASLAFNGVDTLL